jgi:protein ImuB
VLPLFERCRALLDGWTLDAPVIAVRVAVAAVAPLTGEQGDLLSTSWRDLGAADAALERLRAELGAGAIVRAEAQDTHRPEKAGAWKEIGAVGQEAKPHVVIPSGARSEAARGGEEHAPRIRLVREPAPPPTSAARRALDPPESIDVLCDGDVPRTITWRGQRIPITRALGPERLSGDWWDDGYRRDYWRCESGMGEMVVFLDRSDDAWRVQAWAD